MKKYLLLLFILIFFLTFNKNKSINICDKIYVKHQCMDYQVKKNIITHENCKIIIDEATQYSKINGWKEKRHHRYPTYDNRITNNWKCFTYIKKIIKETVVPYFSSNYNVDSKDIVINEIFVVKYMIDGQTSLQKHKDGSEFSFILSLNDSYTGGGTFLHYVNKLIKLQTGDILLFSGQHLHSGEKITFGERWIITGFLSFKSQDYCLNYINKKY